MSDKVRYNYAKELIVSFHRVVKGRWEDFDHAVMNKKEGVCGGWEDF